VRELVLQTSLDDIVGGRLTNGERPKQVAFDWLEQLVYREFGYHADLRKIAGQPREVLELLQKEVPFSLTEQRERLLDLVDELVGLLVAGACPPKKHREDWDTDGLQRAYTEQFGIKLGGLDKIVDSDAMAERLYKDAEAILKKREQETGSLLYLRIFRNFYLQEIDRQWIDHLQNMESLRDGIGLRGYGQRDPKKEYKKEGFDLFLAMMESVKTSVAGTCTSSSCSARTTSRASRRRGARRSRRSSARFARCTPQAAAGGGDAGDEPVGSRRPRVARAVPRAPGAGRSSLRCRAPRGSRAAAEDRDGAPRSPKVGRNDPCWCGSGKKYKQCHLREDQAAEQAGGAPRE